MYLCDSYTALVRLFFYSLNSECRIKCVVIIESTMTSYLFEFEFPPKFKFPPSQGGAGADRTRAGRLRRRSSTAALLDDVLKPLKSDRGERVAPAG